MTEPGDDESNRRRLTPAQKRRLMEQFALPDGPVTPKKALDAARQRTRKREAERKERKKNTRRKELQAGGGMAIGDARDILNSRAAEAQIRNEERGGGGGGGTRNRRCGGPRRCGVCGENGHNARTCSNRQINDSGR